MKISKNTQNSGNGDHPLRTLKDNARPTHEYTITTKHNTHLATWNVRTLNQTGKLAQLIREFDTYRLDILGVSEARWIDRGKITTDGKTFVYSDHNTEHAGGVGIVLSRRATTSMLGWNPVSDQIISARLEGPHARTTFIQAYARTENADDAIKDAFYKELSAELRRTPRHDFTILAGDFNAQIGPERHALEHVIGPHGSATTTNDNGMRLLAFCATHNLVIGNTYFAHKNIHKMT